MRSLSIVMVVVLVLSSTVWAAGPAFTGNLRTSGVVLTNAVQLPDGGTVRSGDLIATKPGGLAVISSSSHGRLEVRPDSEARLANDGVQLERGAVASNRLAIETGGYTIQPQNSDRAWFAVAKRDGRLVVAAHRGNVLIASAGAPPVLVSEGSFAQQEREQEQTPATPQADQPKEPEKGNKKRKAGAAAGAAAGGWAIGGLSHAASVALVVGVGAGVAAASAGAAIALSEGTPSPNH